ncbi:putative aminohydrolase SsnA [Desulfotomaculum defluvii]
MLLVGNGQVITRDATQPYLPKGCVAIQDNLIADVGTTENLKKKYPEAEFIDAAGKIIMPGMINTHMHLYSTFARGMALKDAPPGNFLQILERLWWRLDKVLTLEDVYYSALLPLIDCIKNGTTTIFDHHASPGAVRESLFTIAKATKEIGVRSCLCYEVSDRDGVEVMEQGIKENMDFIGHAKDAHDDLVKGMFGLHASLTLSDTTLAKCCEANAGSGVGYHVHTAEGLDDVTDAKEKYGKRVVERFASFDMLGPKTITAHCVHVNEDEMTLLKQSNSRVVHNPESNMGNAVGAAPVMEMIQRGVFVGLGTDGYTSDMFESFKVANVLHKHTQQHPSAAWVEVPTMLFENNPIVCQEYFEKPLGSLKPGAYADVIIVDYNPPTPMTSENINGHILFGMSGRAVETTIINGRVVMHNRRLQGIDEEQIYAKARELAHKMWDRF